MERKNWKAMISNGRTKADEFSSEAQEFLSSLEGSAELGINAASVMSMMSGLIDTTSRYAKRAAEGAEKGNERIAALIKERKLRYRPDSAVPAPPTELRARPDLLLVDDDEAMDESEKNDDEHQIHTKDIVKPTKMKLLKSSLHDGPTDKELRLNQKAKKMAQRSSLIREMRSQLYDGPEEIVDRKIPTGESSSARERQRYEEKYLTRLPMMKKQKSRRMEGHSLDSILNFGKYMHSDAGDSKREHSSSGLRGKFKSRYSQSKKVSRKNLKGK